MSDAGLQGHSDSELPLWDYAKLHSLTLVSKDNDFRQLSFLHGAPPKVIWLHVGNAPTRDIEALMLAQRDRIEAFFKDAESALLIVEP